MASTSKRSVLFVAAEASPLASVGGLAEVIRFLPRALRDAGHDVRIAIPDYQPLFKDISRDTIAQDLPVQIGDQTYRAAVSKGFIDGKTPIYFFGGSPGFCQVAHMKRDVYAKPNVNDYCFFGKAILEFIKSSAEQLNWVPEILHTHDFHAGFASIYLKTTDRCNWNTTEAPRTVFTVHNLGYPGSFDRSLLTKLGLPATLDNMDGMEFYNQLSPLKGSLNLSDIATTVSPTYAMEILSESYGERLDGVLRTLYHKGRLRGILNGIDRIGLSEEAIHGDPSFSLGSDFNLFLETKSQLKRSVCEKYGLLHTIERPVLVIMGRWGWQKGWPVFAELLLNGYLADFNVVIETWASAGQDAELMNQLRQYATRNRHSVVLVEGEPRSLLRLAGPDFVLLPSIYEPCGLVQMEAMCFATIPIIRKTGGLADTVFDGENGLAFAVPLGVKDMEHKTPAFFEAVKELGSTLRKALFIYQNASRLAAFRKACFDSDNSWHRRVQSYERLYDDITMMSPVVFNEQGQEALSRISPNTELVR